MNARTAHIIDSLKARFPSASEKQLDILAHAIADLGADDALIEQLAGATRLIPAGHPVVLPPGRYAHTFRADGRALGNGGARHLVTKSGVWTVQS